jgi:hypothetical protein
VHRICASSSMEQNVRPYKSMVYMTSCAFPCFLFYISCGERVYVIQIHSSLLQTYCCSLILLSLVVIIWKLQWAIAEIVLWYEASCSTIALWSTIGARTNCMHFILSCLCVSSAINFFTSPSKFQIEKWA